MDLHFKKQPYMWSSFNTCASAFIPWSMGKWLLDYERISHVLFTIEAETTGFVSFLLGSENCTNKRINWPPCPCSLSHKEHLVKSDARICLPRPLPIMMPHERDAVVHPHIDAHLSETCNLIPSKIAIDTGQISRMHSRNIKRCGSHGLLVRSNAHVVYSYGAWPCHTVSTLLYVLPTK